MPLSPIVPQLVLSLETQALAARTAVGDARTSAMNAKTNARVHSAYAHQPGRDVSACSLSASTALSHANIATSAETTSTAKITELNSIYQSALDAFNVATPANRSAALATVGTVSTYRTAAIADNVFVTTHSAAARSASRAANAIARIREILPLMIADCALTDSARIRAVAARDIALNPASTGDEINAAVVAADLEADTAEGIQATVNLYNSVSAAHRDLADDEYDVTTAAAGINVSHAAWQVWREYTVTAQSYRDHARTCHALNSGRLFEAAADASDARAAARAASTALGLVGILNQLDAALELAEMGRDDAQSHLDTAVEALEALRVYEDTAYSDIDHDDVVVAVNSAYIARSAVISAAGSVSGPASFAAAALVAANEVYGQLNAPIPISATNTLLSVASVSGSAATSVLTAAAVDGAARAVCISADKIMSLKYQLIRTNKLPGASPGSLEIARASLISIFDDVSSLADATEASGSLGNILTELEDDINSISGYVDIATGNFQSISSYAVFVINQCSDAVPSSIRALYSSRRPTVEANTQIASDIYDEILAAQASLISTRDGIQELLDDAANAIAWKSLDASFESAGTRTKAVFVCPHCNRQGMGSIRTNQFMGVHKITGIGPRGTPGGQGRWWRILPESLGRADGSIALMCDDCFSKHPLETREYIMSRSSPFPISTRFRVPGTTRTFGESPAQEEVDAAAAAVPPISYTPFHTVPWRG